MTDLLGILTSNSLDQQLSNITQTCHTPLQCDGMRVFSSSRSSVPRKQRAAKTFLPPGQSIALCVVQKNWFFATHEC